MRARRGSAAALVVLLALGAGACSGDPEESSGKPTAQATPDKPPTGVDPAWLIRSTGTRESTEYEAEEQALFVDGDVGVYAAYDTMLGVSLHDGSTVWSNPIDLRGEVPSAMGSKATADHHWHFTSYQPFDAGDRSGHRLYTIDVRDGSIVNDVELDTYPKAPLINVDGTDYLAIDKNVYRISAGGILVSVWSVPTTLGQASIQDLAPVKGTSSLTIALGTYNGSPQTYVGYDTATQQQRWIRTAEQIASSAPGEAADVGMVGDGRLLSQRFYRGGDEWQYVWLLDPATGATRFSQQLQADAIKGNAEHRFHVWTNSIGPENPYSVQLDGDDLLTEDGEAVTRFSLATGEVLWRYDLGEFPHFGPLSGDGNQLLVNVPGNTNGSFLLLDAATGKKVTGWSLPSEYAEGLASAPLMTVTDKGLLLGRNQSILSGVVNDDAVPTDALNDVGAFTYRY